MLVLHGLIEAEQLPPARAQLLEHLGGADGAARRVELRRDLLNGAVESLELGLDQVLGGLVRRGAGALLNGPVVPERRRLGEPKALADGAVAQAVAP